MGFLKRTYKKFEYKPRYYEGEGNPYEIKHKFDEHRVTTGKNRNILAKIKLAVNELKEARGVNKTIVFIVLILTLIFLFLIDFDLSIFLQ